MPQSVWWMRMISSGAEEALGDRQGADLVVGDDAAGVADDVRVALFEAEQAVGVQAGVHAGQDGDLARGRQGQVALVEARGVAPGVLEQFVGRAHGCDLLAK